MNKTLYLGGRAYRVTKTGKGGTSWKWLVLTKRGPLNLYKEGYRVGGIKESNRGICFICTDTALSEETQRKVVRPERAFGYRRLLRGAGLWGKPQAH